MKFTRAGATTASLPVLPKPMLGPPCQTGTTLENIGGVEPLAPFLRIDRSTADVGTDGVSAAEADGVVGVAATGDATGAGYGLDETCFSDERSGDLPSAGESAKQACALGKEREPVDVVNAEDVTPVE